jgi:hypothetical protein
VKTVDRWALGFASTLTLITPAVCWENPIHGVEFSNAIEQAGPFVWNATDLDAVPGGTTIEVGDTWYSHGTTVTWIVRMLFVSSDSATDSSGSTHIRT